MTYVGSQAEATHDGPPQGWRRWVQPSLDLRKLTADLPKNPDSNLLLPFSQACRADLDNVYPTVA